MDKSTLRHLLLTISYPFANRAIVALADVIWQPVAGLRFAYLLFLPVRWWLPMWLWGELGFHILDSIRAGHWLSEWSTPPVNWLLFLITCSVAPFVLRTRGPVRTKDTKDWIWLTAAMLFSAMANAARLSLIPDWWAVDMPQSQLFWQVLLGDINGMLVSVPLILALSTPRDFAERWPRWSRELPSSVLMQCMLVLLPWSLVSNPGFFLTAGLLLPVSAWLAFRGGWRGAACGVSIASALIVVAGRLQGDLSATRDGQILLIVTGWVLLLLGVAVDSLRNRERELAMRNIELNDLALQLRETAHRNQTQADDLRRWITSEVHDEVGQNLTALQLQIRFAENDLGQPQRFEAMREIVGHMRRSVSTLLNQLRPIGMDEFGVRRTLAEGSVSELLKLAGLQYRFRVDGDDALLDRLTDEAQVSLFRIVQESATNTLRYAQAGRFSVHVRVRQEGGRTRVLLRCADDGIGMDAIRQNANSLGLVGINDRVLSLGGKFRIRTGRGGTRILIALTLV